MKSIQIDDDLYNYIASQTQHIGESASDILRRLVMPGSVKPDSAGTGIPMASAPVGDVFALLPEEKLDALSKKVDKFLVILSALSQTHPQNFDAVLQIKGANRVYFARSKEELQSTGSSTNPKAIPDSPYWVITNNNTAKKISMLTEVGQTLGYSELDTQRLVHLFAPELIEQK